MPALYLFLLVLFSATDVSSQLYPDRYPFALDPAGTGGAELVDDALARLSTHRRLLVIGAHPDDEDTAGLSWVARGHGGEAAYLSLSRGEGGQNLIGPELGIGLGLIRTGELVAARQIEGTRQYFTRAYDFGYTRSLEEAFERWPREVLDKDVVRIVRRFKPQVVVAVFPGDERAGHGQHQASGVMAIESMKLAGDADRFPGLTAEGLPPWQPQALYRRTWWSPEDATMVVPMREVDPFSGKSVLQIAAESRSMHRSQDMGTLQRLGSLEAGYQWVEGVQDESPDGLFDGIDTRLSAIAQFLPAGDLQEQVAARLGEVEALARDTRRSVAPVDLERAVEPLARIVQLLQELTKSVRSSGLDSGAVETVADLLVEKQRWAAVALVAAAGVAIDATGDREAVAVGGELTVDVRLWNSGSRQVDVENVVLVGAPGWQATQIEPAEQRTFMQNVDRWAFKVVVSEQASPSQPYYLERRLTSDVYDWKESRDAVRGKPLQPPVLVAQLALRLVGSRVAVNREVVFRLRDQAIGEVRRPIRAVPRLEVSMRPVISLWPLQEGGQRTLEIEVKSNIEEPTEGRLEFHADGDWPSLEPIGFRIPDPGGRQILRVALDAPVESKPRSVSLSAIAVQPGGQSFDASWPVVSYPHVRPLARRSESQSTLRLLDLAVPELGPIGYIRGASDQVPEVLTEVGLAIQIMDGQELRSAELAAYEVIIVGSRAYEIDPALAEANSRLLDWVEKGGLLVVQYQQYQFVRGGFAPYPLEISRPHGRVTDETSPVRLLVPDHRVFQKPNRITGADWQEWVQERGLYFAGTWDDAYTPLLALQDEGQPEQTGALLVARLGEGTYVYTGLSFFRELPAGVPGALRLFANLLALGES